MVDKESLPTRKGEHSVLSIGQALETLHHDMDRLLDRYAPQRISDWFHDNGEITNFAKMDVKETSKTIDINVDVPGLDKEDIDVTLNGNLLTIKGNRESATDEEGEDYHCTERSFGFFQRRITIPTEIDGGKIDASVKKGVLSIHLPKSEKAKVQERKISVKSS